MRSMSMSLREFRQLAVERNRTKHLKYNDGDEIIYILEDAHLTNNILRLPCVHTRTAKNQTPHDIILCCSYSIVAQSDANPEHFNRDKKKNWAYIFILKTNLLLRSLLIIIIY